MNRTVLLSYVKQAWKHALQPDNVVTLTWDREDTTEVIEQRLEQLRQELEDYLNLYNTDTLHEVHIFREADEPVSSSDYAALVKVLDRCTNQVTSFWILENYTCMLNHTAGVGTYASVEFCNLIVNMNIIQTSSEPFKIL